MRGREFRLIVLRFGSKGRFLFLLLLILPFTVWFVSTRVDHALHEQLALQTIELARMQKLITFRRTERWGIGNEMFALASTICISKRYHGAWTVCLDPEAAIRQAFDLSHVPPCQPEVLIHQLGATIFHEHAYGQYDDRVESLQTGMHLVLDRFLQSWRYFIGCEDYIRHLFAFTPLVKDIAQQAIFDGIRLHIISQHNRIRSRDDVITIGVHVRRQDMASDASIIGQGYTVADAEYIELGIEYFVQKVANHTIKSHSQSSHHPVIVIVVSDDMVWCRAMLSHRQDVIYVTTDDDVADMAVLAQCQNVIVTVGTFGWWGAWLSNQPVIYYSKWPRKGSALDRATSHADYFPPRWIPM